MNCLATWHYSQTLDLISPQRARHADSDRGEQDRQGAGDGPDRDRDDRLDGLGERLRGVQRYVGQGPE